MKQDYSKLQVGDMIHHTDFNGYIKSITESREILEAMHRYTQAGKEVPYEWYEELGNTLNIEGDTYNEL